MLFLQISDIHFQAPQCLNPDTDPDRGIRTRMQRHLLAQVARLGRVDAILVSGDIAYRADPAEYKTAKEWLVALADAIGCTDDRIFVVPGNHDVDRGAVKAHMPMRNAQLAIASAAIGKREDALRAQLRDEAAGKALFYGHSAYNAFAAPMSCQIYPDRPYWKQNIDLAPGVKLRIHGLTSTLLSGQNGDDDRKGGLYLSPLQTSLDPMPDVVNMIMCHHPCDWLLDADEVEDALNRRAVFQLFGHKHRQRVNMDSEFVRWGAGAVNPSRTEGPYEPGYNLVSIEVVGNGADRVLKIDTHQFTYQSNPEGFYPIKTPSGGDVFRHSISFPTDVVPSFVPPPQSFPASAGCTPLGATAVAAEVVVVPDAEAAMGERSTRGIVSRFWDLADSDQRELTLDLGLITKEEIALPEPERYGKALIRAKERNLLSVLAERIAKLEEH